MAAKKKSGRSLKKSYRFQLSLPGIAGVAVVCFCLFLWMFLLGIWAGQTFLLPAAKPGLATKSGQARESDGPVETLVPSSKKKPAATRQE